MDYIASFDEFASQLRLFMARFGQPEVPEAQLDTEFNRLSLALFSLQVASIPIYGKLCAKRNITSPNSWREIPALPASAFKEYEVTSLPPGERNRVFHSSGTTQHIPSRHFHSPQSLGLYEESLLPWFRRHFLTPTFNVHSSTFLFLTPPPEAAPHSSLAHMFATVARECPDARFTGLIDAQGAWTLNLDQTIAALHQAQTTRQPVALLGTAFSFVHLLDHCQATQRRLRLPAGSRILETGGYKGRSRTVSKSSLRLMMARWLGIPESHILAEYGMSELSSQAYNRSIPGTEDVFHFPPWARPQVISPETGREVDEGQTGMIRIFDLANVRSVMAVQTEDLAIRRGDGFELIGREAGVEARGCSLMLE